MSAGAAELLDRVRKGGLLAEHRPVLVLLSGGRDSTCLLDVAVRIAGPSAVGALHVNYAVRDAAAGDERHCAELCASLGVALEVRRPRRPETGNLQAWARDQRYGAAAELALGRGADVAAGHTATDQVETILYRLASSPSRRALHGMSAHDGILVRPLLPFTRGQTASDCEERGLRWVRGRDQLDGLIRAGAYATGWSPRSRPCTRARSRRPLACRRAPRRGRGARRARRRGASGSRSDRAGAAARAPGGAPPARGPAAGRPGDRRSRRGRLAPGRRRARRCPSRAPPCSICPAACGLSPKRGMLRFERRRRWTPRASGNTGERKLALK